MGNMNEEAIERMACFNERIIRAQKAVAFENWSFFKRIFDEDPSDLLEDFDLFQNTAINIATRSNSPELLRELLEMLPEKDRWIALTRTNCEKNSLLHEVALLDTVEMANVVFEFEMRAVAPATATGEDRGERLVEMRNMKDETPLFRAAKFGNLKMMKRMVKRVEDEKGNMDIHLRNHKQTILHASVNRQHFRVALWIIKRMVDGETGKRLALEESKIGLTCLQILARMPDAFPNHCSMGCFNKLFYNLLPEKFEIEGCESHELFRQNRDLESGQHDDDKPQTTGVSSVNYAFWRYLAKVFVGIDSLWEKKKQHKRAKCLTEIFGKHDLSWTKIYKQDATPEIVFPTILYNVPERKKEIECKKEVICKMEIERKEQKKQEQQGVPPPDDKIKPKGHGYYELTPLLIAASNGIKEIVELLLKEHPEAVHHVSPEQENIMHMVIKHRQIEIYRFLKKNPVFKMLILRRSSTNRTILHQVARTTYYRGARLAGVAFQLQDELKWYKRVEKVLPGHFYFLCDKDGLTARDVLDIEHVEMLRDAQSWIKETAQSCSTVAVLVATVVFAAAYTILGEHKGGTPELLRSPILIFFTIMDVVALALSLASVVMFLSILTSPFELWDFHESLPRKLTIGFSFLFLSLTTTMLAFSATILLTIRLPWKDWPSTLLYTAAFFPVTIFAMIEFPLYAKLPATIEWCIRRWLVPTDRVIKYCFKKLV